MLWTRGKSKVRYVGTFGFRRESPTCRFLKKQEQRNKPQSKTAISDKNGYKRSSNGYQSYSGFSDWLHIKFKYKMFKTRDTKLEDDDISIEIRPKHGDEDHDILMSRSSTLRKIEEQENVIANIFVKKEESKKKGKLMFDVILCRNEETCTFRETALLVLNTSIKKEKKYIPIASLQDRFELQIETEILEETVIKFRNVPQLCDREEEFVTRRSSVIFKHMRNQPGLKHILQHEKHAPNIAVIGSGGGMRAVIGMCGAMTALKKQGILDSTMYTAGLSGSAWYLLALFANDKQHNPEEMTSFIRQKLHEFSKLQFIANFFVWQWRKYIMRRKHYAPIVFTFTDTFGFLIGNLLNEKSNYLSNQTDKLEKGDVPLPLVSTIQVRDARTIKEYHEWIELSPYEVYIPKYGVAVDMKTFGDSVYKGFQTHVLDEATIEFIQGICGCGYAILKNFRPTAQPVEQTSERPEPDITQQQTPRYKKTASTEDQRPIQPEGTWYKICTGIKFRIASLFDILDKLFIGKVPNVLNGITEMRPLDDNPALTHTEIVDFREDAMMLVDAGIVFNSPYPTVLHPSRKIDVILSFDFSDRYEDVEWPFEELESAADWAKKRRIPFPEMYPQLDNIHKEWKEKDYKEVYVFEGDSSPTIVHFVMINKSFRTKHNFDILPEYKTKKFHYSKQQFDKLNSLVQHNVQENEDTIINCIRKVIERKQKETQIKDKIGETK